MSRRLTMNYVFVPLQLVMVVLNNISSSQDRKNCVWRIQEWASHAKLVVWVCVERLSCYLNLGRVFFSTVRSGMNICDINLWKCVICFFECARRKIFTRQRRNIICLLIDSRYSTTWNYIYTWTELSLLIFHIYIFHMKWNAECVSDFCECEDISFEVSLSSFSAFHHSSYSYIFRAISAPTFTPVSQ